MQAVAAIRDKIYDHFQANAACQKYFFDAANEDEYAAYYNSMYLLQNSTESLWQHRKSGFSPNCLLAYLEFWGVMQAVIIQQDSIAEIYKIVKRRSLDRSCLKSWLELRILRNVTAGHPAKKDQPKKAPLTRSFMGRAFGGYDTITYEQWQQGVGRTHPHVPLGALLDAYAIEAEGQLASVFAKMKTRWP